MLKKNIFQPPSQQSQGSILGSLLHWLPLGQIFWKYSYALVPLDLAMEMYSLFVISLKISISIK